MSETLRKPFRPVHPYLVLLVAILLPGVGQVLNHAPIRGLMMVFFMMVLGVITFNLAAPDVSWLASLLVVFLFMPYPLWMRICGRGCTGPLQSRNSFGAG